MKDDTISRQAAIEALDEQIRQCDKALSSFDISMKDEYAVKVERASLVAFRETLEYLPPAQLAQDLTNGCTDTISRAAVGDAFAPYAEYESNRSNAEWVRRINMVLSALPSAHPDFSAYCDKVYQIALERGRREVIDFVSSMNMCDEVNDEAYTKLIMHFENIPLEGGQS